MTSRSIPKKIKDIILKKFGGHCAFPNCKWPAVALHHVKRFAVVKRHLPAEIVPLCKIHHELAHGGFIENEEGWVLKFRTGGASAKLKFRTGSGGAILSPEINSENVKSQFNYSLDVAAEDVDRKFQKCRRWAMRIRKSV